jgi:hypothetical protein
MDGDPGSTGRVVSLVSDRQEPIFQVATRTFILRSYPSIRVGRELLVARHPCHKGDAHRGGCGMLAIRAGEECTAGAVRTIRQINLDRVPELLCPCSDYSIRTGIRTAVAHFSQPYTGGAGGAGRNDYQPGLVHYLVTARPESRSS